MYLDAFQLHWWMSNKKEQHIVTHFFLQTKQNTLL